jgi:phosphatidylglycerophosphate synthase
MFDPQMRSLKDRVATPIAKRLRHVSPLAMSALAFLVGLLASYAAYQQAYLWAFGLWYLNRTLDGLDGLIARLTDSQSDLGGYVDIVTDYVIYAALPIGLVAGSPSNERYLALAFMLASFYVNSASWMYLAAILEKRSVHNQQTQTTIVMPAGLIGGFETIIVYGIFLLFTAHIVLLFSIFGVLVFFTAFQRVAWAKKNIT